MKRGPDLALASARSDVIRRELDLSVSARVWVVRGGGGRAARAAGCLW